MIQHKEIGRPLGRQSFGYGVSKGKLQKQINFIIELSYYIKENNGCFNKKSGGIEIEPKHSLMQLRSEL